MKINWTINT
ncbi:hypothetical protein AWZ03_014356, partial [Drosophila navojoa]